MGVPNNPFPVRKMADTFENNQLQQDFLLQFYKTVIGCISFLSVHAHNRFVKPKEEVLLIFQEIKLNLISKSHDIRNYFSHTFKISPTYIV